MEYLVTIALWDIERPHDRVVYRIEDRANLAEHVPSDWRERFLRAYDVELQDWVDAVAAGRASGPSAWDGYATAVVSDSAVEALHTGARTAVSLRERPDFYDKA